MKQMTIFTKMIVLIVILLFPVLLLYGRSNYVSVNVVERTLKDANREQLSFFVSQLDMTVQQLSTFTISLNKDPDVSQFQSSFIQSRLMNLDVIYLKEKIMQKLGIQSLSASWDNDLSVFSPSLGEVLSTNTNIRYDEAYLREHVKPGWQVQQLFRNGQNEYAFSYYDIEPYTSSGYIADAKRIMEVRFSEKSIRKALDQFKAEGTRDPFLYHPDYGIIANSQANAVTTAELAGLFWGMQPGSSGILELDVKGNPYLITYAKSRQLGWYVVDYVAVQNILAPITESRNYFYLCVAVLILVSLLAAYLLYTHVQVPIRALVHGVRRIERGDYSNRLGLHPTSEFVFLFESFNRMAERIQNLIETVLTEQIRSRDAVLKQLQSQINPHFLFNCFAFIMSMAKTKNYEAILSMAHRLSKYYRYTTRTEISFCKLGEELEFIQHYLVIQQMRMPRISYEVNIPDSMLDIRIPRLLLQPLVENAIVHGIERKFSAGLIRIGGERAGNICRISVEDDGSGMDEEAIASLKRKINGPLLEEMGCGVWNVNQRINLHFGRNSGLHFSRSSHGGTCAVIELDLSEEISGREGGC